MLEIFKRLWRKRKQKVTFFAFEFDNLTLTIDSAHVVELGAGYIQLKNYRESLYTFVSVGNPIRLPIISEGTHHTLLGTDGLIRMKVIEKEI